MKEAMRRSFRTKLLVSFLVIGILPLLLCTLLMLNTFRINSQHNALENARAELARCLTDLEGHLSACGAALDQMADSPAVLTALTGGPGGERVYSALYAAAAPLTPQIDFSLLDGSGAALNTTAAHREWESLPTDWGVLLAAGQTEDVVFRGRMEDGETAGLRAARGVWKGGEPVGYLVADWKPGGLSELFQNLQTGTGLMLMDGHWQSVWASPNLDGPALAAQLRARLLSGDAPDGDQVTLLLAVSEPSGLTLALTQPQPLSGGLMRSLYLIAAVFLLLCLALCIGLALRLSRQFFEPVRALNEAMGQVEQGNLDVRVNSGGIDELGQLAGRFDRMVDTIQTDMKDSIRREQELRDARIRVMQAQLNPHFLYNTLDTVKWMGKIHKVPEVSAISADLADILRQSISGEEFVPLSQELGLLERYVEIQSIRFPGKFTFRTQIDPDALGVPVPKLMLQPLVENAIIHGFEDGGRGAVTVTARVAGEELTVTVEDDGLGMSEESLARFLAGGESGHLGLRNVDSILRLHYGEGRGLSFPRREGRGTLILIRLPLREKGGFSC